MKSKLLIGVFLFFYQSDVLMAQDRAKDFAGVVYTNTAVHGEDEIKGHNERLEAFLNFPIWAGGNQALGGNITYVRNDYGGINEYFNHSLSNIEMKIVWQKKISERSKIQLTSRVGVFSDFNDLSAKDFVYLIGTNYSVKYSDRLNMGFGFAYVRQFTGYQINPFLSVEYQISDKLTLSGLLPIKPRLVYRISRYFTWNNEISGAVENYRLNAKSFNNAVIQLSGWNAMSRFEYLLKRHHRFYIGIGYNFKSKMSYYEDTNEHNWTIFTFNLTHKAKPVSEIKVSGAKCMIGYNFVF